MIAQLAERETEDLKVTGSIPVRGIFDFFLLIILDFDIYIIYYRRENYI